ncbi:MAG: 5-carboxymethyl-2-hydroxymuconate isomerase [Limnohabitans sp.]
MPHLVILYTGQLDAEVHMTTLCRQMADAMLTVKDEAGQQVFPTGGTRVLAYPAPHYAVADGGTAGQAAGLYDHNPHGGSGDYAFVYLNLRMGRGRSEATQQGAGQALLGVAKAFFAPVMAQRHIGITLQIDVGPEVFDAKHSNIHPLFQTPEKQGSDPDFALAKLGR